MIRGTLAAVGLALALVVVFGGHGFLNYDAAYTLVWARDLADGALPDYEVAFAPTPHPLATLAAVATDLVWLGDRFWVAIAFIALGVLGVLTYALGAAWFGRAAGVVAAAVILTREPVLSFGVRAYVDLPYLCLLLGALLVETKRPRAGTPVLVLLALAGLLRPEAWLFAGLYGLWLHRHGALTVKHAGLVVAAPLLWALSDLVVTGNPLWSLTGTRDNADALGRVTGLQNVPETLPRRLGEILREPALLGAAAGGLLALTKLRSRVTVLGAVAGLVAVGGFCVLAAAGLPILTRYLLLPATILAIFCGAGVAGWLKLDGPDRRPWQAVAAIVVIAFIAFTPGQVDRIDRLQASIAVQDEILDELDTLVASFSAKGLPTSLPNRRAVPQLALAMDTSPRDIALTPKGYYFSPTSQAVADAFILDRRDLDRAIAPPLPEIVRRGRYWIVSTR